MNPYILKRPIISEKSMQLANTRNTYTFEVDRLANKQQLKEAIEELYEVTVLKINTTTRNSRVKKTGKRRLGKQVGQVKKAMVTLKEGDHIELFDIYNE
jgi:large subunit ribosomal protein L23